MHRSSILIAVAVAMLSIGLWAFFNQPDKEAPWPESIKGFSFSPYRANQDPVANKLPSAQDIDGDLALLAGKVSAVRTYSVDGALAEIPELAEKYKINVALGAWLDKRMERNDQQLDKALHIAARAKNIVRLIVGNEALLREDLTVQQMIQYLDKAQNTLKIPVSTAEPWHIWLKYPELVEHVDFIAVHMLPYWEGLDVDDAVDYIVQRIDEIKEAYPGKQIVISEVGWPSNGLVRKGARASVGNQAIFLRRFLQAAKEHNYTYYVMEAFDQPWKRQLEGDVGAYWGVYDANRQPKFKFVAPIISIPEWPVLASISIALALITFSFLVSDSHTLHYRGRSFLALIAYFCTSVLVFIVYDYSQQYLSIAGIIVGVLLVLGMTGVIMVLLAEAHEWAEALWTRGHRRLFQPVLIPVEQQPMVSVHVPCYNEPPDMMIETLNALAAMDYSNFEVIVIDNNTKDPNVWQPVQQHCLQLGPRFRFFHEDPLAGYKAGALNFSMHNTDPKAEIIAVIDADYIVHPHWLRDLAPQFMNPKIGIVQAPQDYRDALENTFKAMSYAEYRGFFYIGMMTRNERNAIIQHGTMTMIRKSVLQKLNGWAEWCITEDAELGLRVFEEGYEANYIAKSYGKGLMPDTFIDFKKQRFRWAFGSMQIIRGHLRQLLLPSTKLSAGQRYHFVAGWLPWMADGFNLLFNFGAIFWTIALIYNPATVPQPLVSLTLIPIVLFVFKMGKLLYLYRVRVHATFMQTVSAAIAGLALTHTIGLAMLVGLFVKEKPFFRTPKQAHSMAIFQALAAAREETLMMTALWLSAYAILITQDTDTLNPLIWSVMLVVQSTPYFASLVVSIISAFPKSSARFIGEIDSMKKAATEFYGHM